MRAPLQQPPTPPTPPTPPASPGPFIVRGGDLVTPGAPMTRQDVIALQARRSELSGQLEGATRQRRQISDQLRRADGVDKAGLESRIGVIDARITRLEGEIDQVNEQIASTAATRAMAGTVVNPRGMGPSFRGNISPEPILFAVIFFVMTPIALSISRLIWKRGSLRSQPAITSDSSQRLERMEQAMDAIAIEVERVSEGQRFVTRLLSERNAGALGMGQQAAEPVRVPLSDADRVR
ncbi:MAG TPA: hypothetical protein VGP25_16415 [Gemmatimonadaceae bacterium]|jgi:hypothetical protein|nr:hypothetical protein [Gemmatimonadaceae bacterium]